MVERSLGQFLNEAQEYLDEGDINKSLQTANEAHDIANIQQNYGSIARALNIISLCYFELKNKLQSLKKAKEAMTAALKVDHKRQIAYAHFSLAKAHFLGNKINKAEVTLHEGLLLTKNNNFGDIEVKMRKLLSEIESIHSEQNVIDTENVRDESELEKTSETEQIGAAPDESPLKSKEQKSNTQNELIGGDPNSILEFSQGFNQDLIATEDLGLGYDDYVNAFSNFLSSDKKIDQLAIGLHGEWGRGKSTLMDSIKRKLEQNGFTTVSFNAWKYKEEDNIWGAFFHNLIVQVSEKLKWYNKIYYRLQLYRHKWVLFSLYLFLIASLSYPLFSGFFSENLSAIIVNSIFLVAAIIFGFIQTAKGLLSKIGLSVKDLFSSLGDRDKLGVMGTMDDDFINFYNIYSKINTDKKPIVIFIDDLDRCPPDRIVSVVNAINTLTIKRGFIFFIGYDKDFVAAAISSQYKDIIEFSSDESNKSNFGYDFLDKIIQIPFKIPIGSKDSILKYTESILNFSDAENSSREEANSKSIEEEKKVNSPKPVKIVDGPDSIKLDDSVEIEIEEKPSEEALDQITLEILKVGVTNFGLNNPRSIKKFVNVFKLLVYIAYESGLLRNNQITPNQIGYYLIFNMFHWKELNFISEALSSNTDLSKIKPDEEANVNLTIFPFIKSNLGFQFNNFVSDIDLAKFTVIRNLVGRSFTF